MFAGSSKSGVLVGRYRQRANYADLNTCRYTPSPVIPGEFKGLNVPVFQKKNLKKKTPVVIKVQNIKV